ncbi:aquaporin-like protein [Russula earlei]|uniref:Aquaporin-like protein n=1 Tax=Russula earlei TaxID=71964 RepID=A0ACC0UK40_9AGAM|nr:aquaporin-like protein [Russula earlei]
MTGHSASHIHDSNERHHHLADIELRPAIFRSWERVRNRRVHWLVQCVAETFAVFCYCYAGVGATAAYIVGNILNLNIGSYGVGIVVALVVCTATSGGHFSPAVTIVHVIFNGFPPAKAIRYIIAQIFGGFLACLFVYWQWNTLIKDAEAALIKAGEYDTVNFSSLGPAGILALYVNPAAPLGLVFLNEFMADFFIGIVIAAVLDPTNFFAPPAAAPWIVGLTYGTAIWGFSANGLAANTARDVGGRLAAIAIWGTKASGGRYAAIAALTNIPATVAAYAFYELVLKDSNRSLVVAPVVTAIGKEYHDSRAAQLEHIRYLHDNVTIRYGSGSSADSEKGVDEQRLEK